MKNYFCFDLLDWDDAVSGRGGGQEVSDRQRNQQVKHSQMRQKVEK